MRSEKIHLVNEIGQMITGSDYIYFISYSGMSVKVFDKFRNELARHDASCTILKNTLIRKAAEQNKLDNLAGVIMTGDTAMISGKGDAGAIAKVIKDFNRINEKLSAKGGFLEGAVLNVSDVDAIAALPPKPVLYAMLLGVLQAPSRDLVSVLNAKAASVVNVLNNYKEKLEK